MFGKIWRWISLAAAAVAGALYIGLQVVRGQRDQQSARADREAAGRVAVEEQRDEEREVVAAQQDAREESEQVAEELEQRRQEGRRPDRFGDPRLNGSGDEK